MNAALDSVPSKTDRIRHDLVGLKMPRALGALDNIVRRLEHGELSALEAIDILPSEELTLRENSRIKTALRMGRLATIKTVARLPFHFPARPRSRSDLHARNWVSSKGTRPSISSGRREPAKAIAVALGVEAVKAGKSVYFCTLATS